MTEDESGAELAVAVARYIEQHPDRAEVRAFATAYLALVGALLEERDRAVPLPPPVLV